MESKKSKLSNIERKLEDVHETYGIERFELSKITIIASTALLIVSIHGALSFNSALQDVKSSNAKISEATAIINSNEFQSDLDALSRTGTPVAERILTAARRINEAGSSFESLETTESGLEAYYTSYQWLALVAIMGEVAGISIRFI
ncbi:MAG: hypothetical protein H8Z69_03560 [Nanohaloarchaea archaeon]|nr:hypothetical protein [Candidatus Nanohaloarchaea archaeon]